MPTYDVAVIGLGAMGSAALYELARRGRRAIGIEQFEPGHDRGSSHGESRLIRLAYFEDPAYVPLVRLAYDRWRAREARSGQRLLTVTGIVEAGIAGSPIVEASRRSSIEHGIAHEVLTARRLAERFPAFELPADWDCVYQADAGVLEPERAIGLFLAAAGEMGAQVRANTKVVAVEPVGGGVRVRLAGGEVIEAGSAIIAAGPWIAGLAPFLRPHLTLTRQVLAWFDPVQPALTTPQRMPVFLLHTPDDVIYGVPDFRGTGVKAGSHEPCGRLTDADAPRLEATAQDIDRILRPLAAYIPAAAGPLRQSTTCLYTKTPDEHFIVGPHPHHPQIVLASPCSGHGFKFAPILGEALADLALTGASPLPIALFSPTRFHP